MHPANADLLGTGPNRPLLNMDNQLPRTFYWAMFFSSITAMLFHPGNMVEGDEEDILMHCAEIADRMLKEYERRT